ncbi:hypothetical protein ACQKP5_09925 [Pseudomonas vancouverensis]|uniref:hypothetical protein n=1 Tax=Pseudomonas vancouverensis TaxID=95300 RepID=UPI003CFC1E51
MEVLEGRDAAIFGDGFLSLVVQDRYALLAGQVVAKQETHAIDCMDFFRIADSTGELMKGRESRQGRGLRPVTGTR